MFQLMQLDEFEKRMRAGLDVLVKGFRGKGRM